MAGVPEIDRYIGKQAFVLPRSTGGRKPDGQQKKQKQGCERAHPVAPASSLDN